MSDLQPDTGEVLQEEAPDEYTSVAVCVTEVKTPVRVQRLPEKGGSTRTRVISDTRAVQVLDADHRRGSAVVMSIDEPVYIGIGRASIEDPSTMSIWPINVPWPCGATVDVYVRCATDAATSRVSITTGLWAEG